VLVDVVTLGAEQMERKIGRSSLRDATIATGVSVDKVLALQGQSPVGEQVAVVQMRRPKSERKRVGRIMRLITRLLNEPGPLDPKDQLRVEALIKSMGRKEPAD
jgi:hypothetical protein